MDVDKVREIADGLAQQDNEVDQEIARELYEAIEPQDYQHLRVRKDDRVKITVTNRDTGLPFTAEGPVLSAYDKSVYKPGTNSGIRNIIGYQPAGIEMTDELTNLYRYWKQGDGGRVWKLVDEEYVQVYPIHFEGVVR